MRGKKLILALTAAMCLTGCGAAGQAEVVQPQPAAYTDKAGDEMPDGTYDVSFTSDDLQKKDDGYVLTMEFYNYDSYSKEDALALKEGSVINITVNEVVDGTFKAERKDLTIDSIETSKNDNGDVDMIAINGGIENGGVELYLDLDFDVFVNRTMDDHPVFYSIGTGTIPVSTDMTFQDCYDADTLPDGVVTYYDDLPDSLVDAEQKCDFNNNAMQAVIRDGEIVQLIRNWIP